MTTSSAAGRPVHRESTVVSALGGHEIPLGHPRLFGSRARLQRLAVEQPDAYARTRVVAGLPLTENPEQQKDYGAVVRLNSKLWSMALCAAIDEDRAMARAAIELVFAKLIDRPPRTGHDVFGLDAGYVGVVYDLCYEHWSGEERQRAVDYVNACLQLNHLEEMSVFHDGWWAYKHAGLGLAWLATIHDNERAVWALQDIDRLYRVLYAPATEWCGRGGGHPEGYYLCYWLHDCAIFFEAARHCMGVDYYALAPSFWRNRAAMSMFEQFPGLRERGSRRTVCIGDGRGRFFRQEADRVVVARRILCRHYLTPGEATAPGDADPAVTDAHRAVAAFDLAQPRLGADEHAWLDLLFPMLPAEPAALQGFPLSHVSAGPGYAAMRGSWSEDATWLFFKCGPRYTSHQHLDVGHFTIVRHEELAGEGGHYDDFGTDHAVDHYIRSIAHNTVLVHDPDERWSERMRAVGRPPANDGGQAFPWPGTSFRHNGDASDLDQWRRNPALGDIAELTAFAEHGAWAYVAGDCTRAYSRRKLAHFTRQILFMRPGTTVVFDRVRSTHAEFRKTWVLHAMKRPERRGDMLVVTNGAGRLFVQPLLPQRREVRLVEGDERWRLDGRFSPSKLFTGADAECRVEISPSEPATDDCFLHVLTAVDATVDAVPAAVARRDGDAVVLTLGGMTVRFLVDRVGGEVVIDGRRQAFATTL